MRNENEITELRREAAELLRAAPKTIRRQAVAERMRTALTEVLKTMIELRAVELERDVNDLSLKDVIVTDDDRAIQRQLVNASIAAGLGISVKLDDRLAHVVARLAIQRGWSITDAARAILADADARVDDVRDSAAHGKAKRIGSAVKQAARERLAYLERQLSALEGNGPPSDAAGPALVAAVLSLVTGEEVPLELLVEGLRGERVRLAAILGGGRRAAGSGNQPSTVE